MRDSKRAEVEAKQASLTSPEAAIQEFDIGKRYLNVLVENGIKTAGDVLTKLQEGGDDAMIAISGFGRKQLSDLKKLMRARGYQLPSSDAETNDAV
ncbi:MAG TPA: DNA-directed RNA polymerase subunit alpha C-terminal domain-containing protein [Aggregatilineales bacterium]|nr:DNA-directed RNA polymerase subunit alpha C-terminal domain-containing protein [Aggregatilineales bacterium]